MSKGPENFPSKAGELYRLTPELKKVDFANIETPITEITDPSQKGPHSLAEAIQESLSRAEAEPENVKLLQKAIVARLASEGNYRVSQVEAGDRIWIQDEALHFETADGEKLFFPLANKKADKAPEGFTLVGKREDIKNEARRALDSLKDPGSTNLYEYMRAAGLNFNNDRPKLWKEMQDGGITVEELRSNPLLKDIPDNFFEKNFSVNKRNAKQNIAILQFLKKKDSEPKEEEEEETDEIKLEEE